MKFWNTKPILRLRTCASHEVTAAEIETIEVQEESSSGDPEISYESSAVVRFTTDGDSVTVQILSKDAAAYYDSAESASFAVLDEAPARNAAEAGNEAASGEAEGVPAEGGQG